MSLINCVNLSISGYTGTGNFSGSTSPIFVTPILGAASASSLNFTTTSGIIGTTTNNSAASGSVGQILSSNISASSGVTLTTTVPANITSLSLTAGDWDVRGNVVLNPGTGANIFYAWASTTSATIPDLSLVTYFSVQNNTYREMANEIPYIRVSINTTTTVYLSCYVVFSSGTSTAGGIIYARRRR